jgi:hypothetical protein
MERVSEETLYELEEIINPRRRQTQTSTFSNEIFFGLWIGIGSTLIIIGFFDMMIAISNWSDSCLPKRSISEICYSTRIMSICYLVSGFICLCFCVPIILFKRIRRDATINVD